MKTIILMWNPEISDVSVTNFRMSMHDEQSTWEVRCHDRAEIGDLVYLVRCDKPTGGIVQRGIIIGEPVKARHWYKENANSWYAQFAVTHVMNPLSAPLITVERLQREIPGFKWDGGPSGRVLRAGWAKRLEAIWSEYLLANPGLFKGKSGYDFSKKAYSASLDATLFFSNNTDIWLNIGLKDACLTLVVNLDQPDDEDDSITVLDGRERTSDLSFSVKDACWAFGVSDRFELFRIMVRQFSDREALKLLTDYLYDHKVKFELEEYDDWNPDDDNILVDR